MKNYRYAIVVGASSGIGEELVRQLASTGCRIAAVARRNDRLQKLEQELGDRVFGIEHDVRSLEVVPDLFMEITKVLGGLDLIIYAAGVMPNVAGDEFNTAKDQPIVDINCLGAVAWLNEAANRFQGTKHGTIVGIGSVAGDRGRAGQPVYNASKAFLATYLEALRNRLDRKGVCVVTIKPGPVQSEMTAHLDLKGAMSASNAAALILKKSNRAGEHYLKLTHRIIFFVIRHLPSSLMRRLNL